MNIYMHKLHIAYDESVLELDNKNIINISRKESNDKKYTKFF